MIQRNPMIQVALCEQALTKTNKKPIQKTTRAKQCFFLKRTHLNLNLTDISSTWLAVRECKVGFPPVFVVGEFCAFEIFKQNDCFRKVISGQNMIISPHLLIINQLYFDSDIFIKLKT